jgi:integrase
MNSVNPIRDQEKIEQMKKILREQSFRNYFLFVSGINIGIRVGDLLRLRVEDVRERSHIVIREQKTGKEKKFKINDNLQREINCYVRGRNDDEFLFLSRQGGKRPLTRVSAWRILNSAAREVGLEGIGTHTMRKTFGFHYYRMSKDIAMLQKIFNHSSPSVTLRYIGITQDAIDESLERFSL